MKVSEIMSTDVQTCTAGASLSRVARIMWERDCGCVPVVDAEGRPAGMITDRDVCMGAYTQARRLDEITVERSMSRPPVTVCADDDVEEAERLMREHQLRRLAVVDDDGRLAGLLSLSDIVQSLPAEGAEAAHHWSDDLLVTLASVTRPRRRETLPATQRPAPVVHF